MIKVAGVVFDFYDDSGALLRSKLAGVAPPRDILDAERFDSAQLEDLPDSVFAGVIRNGEEVLRKFACVDKGNTMISTIYFLETKGALPEQAQTKIASNLLAACRYFETVPPPALAKVAAGKLLIKGDGAEIVAKRGEKTADLTGTTLMPITAAPARKTKIAAVISDPYVDVTGGTVAAPREYDYDDSLYALTSKEGHKTFPLKTWTQVKTANDFFVEQYRRMHPRTRRAFCVKLASRANELGFDLHPIIDKYGAEGYAGEGEMAMAIDTRRQMWREHHDEAVSLLDGLMEKKAEVNPDVFAETLFRLDCMVAADRHYDRHIVDPWQTTYGIQKEAEWRWVSGNDVLTEGELKNFAASSYGFLKENFGEELARGMSRNPVRIFDSLPLPKQRTIARLAHQQGDGGSSAVVGLQ
jgi:hypothetical protein